MTAEDVAAQLARERALKQAEKMETIGRLTGAIASSSTSCSPRSWPHAALASRCLPTATSTS